MIELVSVEVENFRAFTEARFEPASQNDGMTAITGANGSGKSTLIVAIVWALYGVTPGGTPVRALRRQGTVLPVIARITFRHDNQVVEVTRSLRGKNDTTVANIEVDGVQQTNVSARTATAWIVQRLKLDVEGFLTAFVVRQKEVDDLVTARPADRRKTIERLAGVERMADALALARQTARDASKILETIAEPEVASTILEQQIAESETRRNVLLATVAETETVVSSAEAEELRVKTCLAEISEIVALQNKLVNKVDVVDADIRNSTSNLSSLRYSAQNADNLAYTEVALLDAEKVLQEFETAVAIATSTKTTAVRLEREALERDIAQAKAETRVAEIEETLTQTHNIIAQLPPATKTDVHNVETFLANLTRAIGGLNNEEEKVAASLTALTAHDDPTCPTCESSLPNPEILIKSLTTTLETLKTQKAIMSAKVFSAEENVRTVVNAAGRVSQLEERVTRLEGEMLAAKITVTETRELAHRTSEEAAVAADIAHTTILKANDAETNLPTQKKTVDVARRANILAEEATELAKTIPHKEAELAKLTHQRSVLALEVAELSNRLGDTTVAEWESTRAEIWNTLTQTRLKLSTAKNMLQLEEREREEAVASLKRAQVATQRRVVALKDVERATAVSSALEEFRRDRLARLAPELSEVASDFVSRMTEGKYLTVELDEDFTPIVTDIDGVSRPASWLSGGEESAVALALRVAIGEVLAGQRGGLLILDEVLTAQDSGRRAATMAAIRELPRQVIVINHVAEASDMVDYVIEARALDDGSTLYVYPTCSESPAVHGGFE